MAASLPSIFADTNVLVSAALRDILIEAALDDLISLSWSPQVLTELRRVLLRRPGAVPARVDAMVAAMTATLPSATSAPTPRLGLRAYLPDPDDLPILLAALNADCSVLLTFNLKDFPTRQVQLESGTLAPTHPDAFLVHLLTTQPTAFIAIIQRILGNLLNPPMSRDAYLAHLVRAGLPNTAMLLRPLLG